MDLTFGLQILGVIFSAAAPLLFAAPRLPYVKGYVRPSTFEEGWYTLRVKRRLNYEDAGFNEVLHFLVSHRMEDGHFADVVADDLDIGPEEILPEAGTPAVEELRILTRPSDFSEQVLICYDEETEGPPGESEETPNFGLTKLNLDLSGDDWRWFGPLSGVEYNALRYTNEEIDSWTAYGAVSLSVGVFAQILAITLS